METSETQLNAQSETTDLDDFGLIDYESPSVDPQIADNYSDDEMVPKEPSSPNTVPDALAASTTQSTTEHNEQGDGLIDYDESVPLEADGVQVEADTDAEVAEAETKIVETTLEDPDAHATEADAKDVAVTVEVLETNMDMPHMDLDTAEYPTAHSVDSSASKDVADTSVPPETWVFSDGEWMVYLGPEQHAFGAEHQRYLFDISLADLINELQTDCALSEDVELALEFPSLALTIDKRDQESDQLSLSMLYSCHAAAILMGKLPVDFVNSSYFSQSAAKVQPSLSAFLFVIHTRPKLQSALQRIMSIKEQAEQENEVVVEQPDSIEQPADVEQGDEEEAADSNANEEEAQANGDDANGPVEEDQEGDEQQTTTAALLADETEEDDEDEDEDFVADEEDENDHVMDADALDEAEEVDNSDVEIEEVESGNQTRVDSENASPSNKRTKAQQISGNSAQSDDTEQEVIQVEEDEPAAKKSKSDSSVDQQPQPSVAA
ncbi:hypothetical protein IWW36_005170 [Coemansia brasiliensis]|uniref:Uncharacterized protein n=1 Tax=Coemansia brasiliensis TaxID=2650707 RepID=A0A9W8I268_9FUNG|nr:hypothetical protein IWW36_005170 [Coemansia brasiliensis]